MVDRGTGCGPIACSSSARPMHWPAFRPVQGMPSTAGMSGLPGIDWNVDDELGTKNGVHTVVKTSSSSPGVHAARLVGAFDSGVVSAVMAGAAASATAKPLSRSSRRTGDVDVAILRV